LDTVADLEDAEIAASLHHAGVFESPVDTIAFILYSARANDLANPSPPSSSRHSAAFDEVCIAIR
jgi:hypothetical protein